MGTFVSVSLKIPYKKLPDGKGGFGYYAALPVNIALPTKNAPRSKRFEAIIDSGATRCVFHADIGKAIGLDVEAGEIESTLGIAGSTNMYLHDISLYAPGGIIVIRAGFSFDLPVAGLLGMTGFFDNFKSLSTQLAVTANSSVSFEPKFQIDPLRYSPIVSSNSHRLL